jgi:hypothetical protein
VENLKNVREPISVYRIMPAGEELSSAAEQPASSIIPGYHHDIYISYREIDNKYDGWVSEFASKLERELGATMKDKVSVWFNKNPEKNPAADSSTISSLILLPIVSQTYCDP